MVATDRVSSESKDFSESLGGQVSSMRLHPGPKECVKCGATANLTKHHYNGQGKGPWDWFCRRPCHDEAHGMRVKDEDEEKRQKRLMRRVQLRVKRDILLVDDWVRIADVWTPEQRQQMRSYLESFH